MKVITLRLTSKLTLILVFFAAALLMAVSLLAYDSGRKVMEVAATAELESTAGEKEQRLTAWVEEKKSDIQALSEDPAGMEKATALITPPSQPAAPDDARARLIEQFAPRILSHEFTVLMLLDPQTGQVVAATDSSEEGRSRMDRPYFLEGKKGTYLTPIYFSLELQAPAMTASAPVFSGDGKLLAVLAGRVNLKELNAIIQLRSGSHQTDDSFLVNTSHQFITQPRLLPDPAVLERGISTLPVERCLQHRNGTVFATDYRDVPAIAVYRWLPETQMCLIVTISQAEALASEHSFAMSIWWIGCPMSLARLSMCDSSGRGTLRHGPQDTQES